MDIDYSKIYSVVSANEERSKEVLERVFEEFEGFNKYRGVASIREHLMENYDLKKGQHIFFMKNNAPVKIIELERALVLQLEYQNENRSIVFNKEEK